MADTKSAPLPVDQKDGEAAIVAPKKTPAKKSASTPVKTNAPQASAPVAPKKAKAIKVNPSASYIGFAITAKTPQPVNYRQGKANTITCSSVKCTAANATGRRLTLSFINEKNEVIAERKVYKEYFEKMAQNFGAELPE